MTHDFPALALAIHYYYVLLSRDFARDCRDWQTTFLLGMHEFLSYILGEHTE